MFAGNGQRPTAAAIEFIDDQKGVKRGDRAVPVERQLRESSDKEITEFQENLEEESIVLRRGSSLDQITQSQEDKRWNIKIATVATNLHSIRRRLLAIGRAFESAEKLRLSASRDISAELNKLRDGLPEVVMEPTGV